MPSNPLLRLVLALAGFGVLIIGANVGLGGIRTLGLQVAPDFVTPANPDVFAVQDNHTRFLGGVFAACGLAFLVGAVLLAPMVRILIALCAMIAVAGLFRLSQGGLAVVTGPDVLPSFLLEIIVFPLIALWLHRAVGKV